jgi:hypothetical protein
MFEMWLLAQFVDILKMAVMVTVSAWAIVPAVRAMRKK